MPEYHIKGNGGRRMLGAEEILMSTASFTYNSFTGNFMADRDSIIQAMRIYRNQGIQQASEVCCETLTDGFRISNVPAVLALKEEV